VVLTGKPDPTLFLKAAHLLDVPPEHCVVVEHAPAADGFRCLVTGAEP
jgi:HAD superfamily hydrolase (TIGR01509 family)